PDGVLLRGWKVRSAHPNGSWVLVFHGVADNRMGVLEHARILLLAGYGVVMMDSRAHGASDGAMATYGWLERKDTHAVIDALEKEEHPSHVFAWASPWVRASLWKPRPTIRGWRPWSRRHLSQACRKRLTTMQVCGNLRCW